MHEVTQDMQKAGLDAFMTWREAPHGIGFGDVVIAVYSAMEKARVGKEVEAAPYWTGTSEEADAAVVARPVPETGEEPQGVKAARKRHAAKGPIEKMADALIDPHFVAKAHARARAKAPAKKA